MLKPTSVNSNPRRSLPKLERPDENKDKRNSLNSSDISLSLEPTQHSRSFQDLISDERLLKMYKKSSIGSYSMKETWFDRSITVVNGETVEEIEKINRISTYTDVSPTNYDILPRIQIHSEYRSPASSTSACTNKELPRMKSCCSLAEDSCEKCKIDERNRIRSVERLYQLGII